eukprot:CAMPEP_0113700320 /NCGR_PEP_ID=MMETSP0038_2-20120614/23888_1 /TAXON_ID=2898 /ORGANISM="Cryptomonas paramecium" /LENGTH=143 /DNA_ID=CAMNT_0000623957 /DNA_START=300 /DNA_END=726 /DNA_ORIENTATION=- /assembly_acc=CAM_ASM_000170
MYFTIIPNVASFLLDDTVNSPGCHPRRAGREGDGKVMTTALRAHAEPPRFLGDDVDIPGQLGYGGGMPSFLMPPPLRRADSASCSPTLADALAPWHPQSPRNHVPCGGPLATLLHGPPRCDTPSVVACPTARALRGDKKADRR